VQATSAGASQVVAQAVAQAATQNPSAAGQVLASAASEAQAKGNVQQFAQSQALVGVSSCVVPATAVTASEQVQVCSAW
jgi:hypothetical protein